MKKNTNKNKLRVLGRIIDADIREWHEPDPDIVRETEKAVAEDQGRLSDEELELKLKAVLKSNRPIRFHKKRRLAVTLAAAVLLMATVFAVAASPAIWKFLSFPFTRDSGQLTEVPEGYVGIYTADDLDLIRENPDGNFILMADIDLGGKEHTPIGDRLNPFEGRFNGNGHIISNFKITASGASVRETVRVDEARERYRASVEKLNGGDSMIDAYNLPAYAIYGIDGGYIGSHSVSSTADDFEMQYISAVGFFGNAGNATVTGLGIENAVINVTDADYTAVGVIAGQVGYISSSYVKDSSVSVEADTSDVEAFGEKIGGKPYDIFDYMSGHGTDPAVYSISAGLLCGEAFAVDSCYTAGDIKVIGSGSTDVEYSTASAGLIVGYASSAVSSYSTARLNVTGNVFSSEGIIGKKRLVPVFIYLSAFDSLLNYCMSGGYLDLSDGGDRNNPEISFDKKKFAAFYLYDLDNALLDDIRYANIKELEEVFFVSGKGTETDENFCYIFQLVSRYEMMYFQHVLDKLGDEDEIISLYRTEGMRIGDICCYIPDSEQSEDYYEGFDFTDVWTMKDGMPSLRIFQ